MMGHEHVQMQLHSRHELLHPYWRLGTHSHYTDIGDAKYFPI